MPPSADDFRNAIHRRLHRATRDGKLLVQIRAGDLHEIELPPFAGIDEETLEALAGTLADAAPERCTTQVIH